MAAVIMILMKKEEEAASKVTSKMGFEDREEYQCWSRKYSLNWTEALGRIIHQKAQT